MTRPYIDAALQMIARTDPAAHARLTAARIRFRPWTRWLRRDYGAVTATCAEHEDGRITIFVDEAALAPLSADERMLIVLHELAHALADYLDGIALDDDTDREHAELRAWARADAWGDGQRDRKWRELVGDWEYACVPAA